MLNKEIIIKEFRKYAKNFNFSEESIRRKYCHSIRVMDFSERIAISENLTQDDIELSIIIGLLHDYGRFEQWTKYKTFNDINSIDHGDLAIKLLFEQNEIEKYYNKKENYDIIYNAIKYHNKYSISDNLDNKNIMMCKLIRDADKLDIMDILVDGTLKFECTEEQISEKVKTDFYNYKLIDRKNIKNKNDSNILKLALIYDYNYNFSYNYTKEHQILEKLYNKIENKEMFYEYFEYMKMFLNKMK